MTLRNIKHHYTWLFFLLLWPCLFITSCGPNPAEKLSELTQVGKTFYRKSQYTSALQAWQQAQKIPVSKPASLYLIMAKSWLKLAEPDKAAAIIKKGQTFYPHNTKLLIETARIQVINSHPALAEKTLNSITSSQLAEIYILRGDILSIKGQLTAAESAYKKALKIRATPQAVIRLAVCRLGRNDEDGAAAAYNQLSQPPKDPEILNQMGMYWRLKGDPDKAEKYILQAVEFDPGNLLIKKSLAEFYFINNRLPKAAATITGAIDIEPASQPLNNFLIDILLQQNKLPEAAAILKRQAETGRKDIIFHLLQGKYFLLNRQPYLAISQFSEAIKNEPDLAIAHYLLALAYLADHRSELAQQSAIEALTLNNYFSRAELLLADIYYQNGQYSQALEYVNRILPREPENFRPQLLKGCILLALQQFQRAGRHFDKAAALNPTFQSSYFFSALTVELAGKPDKAARLYHKILQKNPEMIPAAQRYIALLQRHTSDTGQIDKSSNAAIKSFIDSLPAAAVKSPEFQYMLASTYSKSRKSAAAITHFQRAIQLDTKRSAAYMGLADIYEQQKSWPAFKTTLQECIANNPQYIPAILKLAGFYNHKQEPKSRAKAKALIEKGMQQSPDSPRLANSLAWLLLEGNEDIDRAFILAQKAYEKLPQDAAINDTLGWAYFKKKIFTRAKWLLEDALAKAPSQPVINIHLGQVLLAEGKSARALHYLETGMGLNPPQGYKDIAQRLIMGIKQDNN